jgi:methylenetetrahydrofolate--tRNA-(uracil-5-)-methyltransferase
LIAGRFAAAQALGLTAEAPPATTALGALLSHITGGADASSFQPMNVNFGLFPPAPITSVGKRAKAERKPAMVARARADLTGWLARDQLSKLPASA